MKALSSLTGKLGLYATLISLLALAAGVVLPAPELTRNFYTTSSCGICGKASIEAVETVSAFDVSTDAAAVTATALVGFPAALRSFSCGEQGMPRQTVIVGFSTKGCRILE